MLICFRAESRQHRRLQYLRLKHAYFMFYFAYRSPAIRTAVDSSCCMPYRSARRRRAEEKPRHRSENYARSAAYRKREPNDFFLRSNYGQDFECMCFVAKRKRPDRRRRPMSVCESRLIGREQKKFNRNRQRNLHTAHDATTSKPASWPTREMEIASFATTYCSNWYLTIRYNNYRGNDQKCTCVVREPRSSRFETVPWAAVGRDEIIHHR